MDKQQDIKAVERAKKDWEAMEREIERKAHDLVQNTPSRAEEEESEDDRGLALP